MRNEINGTSNRRKVGSEDEEVRNLEMMTAVVCHGYVSMTSPKSRDLLLENKSVREMQNSSNFKPCTNSRAKFGKKKGVFGSGAVVLTFYLCAFMKIIDFFPHATNFKICDGNHPQ